MDEQRQQRHEDRGQRPAPEQTGEVADADLEQAAGGGDSPPVNVDLLGFRRARVDTSPIELT